GKATNESRDQVFRYIRLTNLIPELLAKVDEDSVAFSPAVELSCLTEQEQRMLTDAMETNSCTPSHAQSIKLKKLSQQRELTEDIIYAVLSEEKANQKERISFPYDDIRRFFPKNYTSKDIYNAILKLVVENYQRRERARKNRDER
ncbi:MAG: chromosome partitioning protein ParB, partial [Oscillospiraceae bacterium]|nr:chromosome partitioning protein ParB [Oscillospiraceae bacterium]